MLDLGPAVVARHRLVPTTNRQASATSPGWVAEENRTRTAGGRRRPGRAGAARCVPARRARWRRSSRRSSRARRPAGRPAGRPRRSGANRPARAGPATRSSVVAGAGATSAGLVGRERRRHHQRRAAGDQLQRRQLVASRVVFQARRPCRATGRCPQIADLHVLLGRLGARRVHPQLGDGEGRPGRWNPEDRGLGRRRVALGVLRSTVTVAAAPTGRRSSRMATSNRVAPVPSRRSSALSPARKLAVAVAGSSLSTRTRRQSASGSSARGPSRGPCRSGPGRGGPLTGEQDRRSSASRVSSGQPASSRAQARRREPGGHRRGCRAGRRRLRRGST